MDSGEGGGGDGGGGEERDADLSPQALTLPLLTQAVIPEQGSSSHTSATAPAKEPLTLLQQEEEGAEGSQAREKTQGGEQKGGGQHLQENGGCQKQGMKEDVRVGYLLGYRKEEREVGVGEASDTGGLPAALSSRHGEEEKEEEEAISNQSQTKSKCSLLPQQSQHSSSSSTAKASGTLDSKIAASPKPSPTPSTSPKHFTCPSSSSALLSETEVKDIKGDQGWISGFPQSFKSQQSTLAFSPMGTEPASAPGENDGLAGLPHSSISNGDGAKAPEPNDSKLVTELDDERDKEGEQKETVLKNLNQDLSPNSLTSHMTIMHSRNSCKTLKCPKCNWHYKSQHTLQVHMKEKHPETGGQCVCGASGGKCVCGGATRGVCGYCSSGKPHPRLARGETYACGYKPYRCEVCDYATSSKGNLSIHMQSDKHLNNVQNGGHSNGHMPTSHVAHANNSSSSNGHTVDEQAYKLQLPIHMPTTQPSKLTPPAHSHSHGKRWRCDVCDYETSIARNLRIHTTSEKHTHNMLRLQRGYYLSHCRSLSPQFKHLQNTGGELLNMRMTGQPVPEQPVTLGSTLTPSPSPSPSPPPAPSLSPTGPLSQGVFQCLICSCFSSDSLESVEQHLNAPRSLPQSEWCSLVAGGCHCRLCGYTTPLRANFSLHCQTDRHRTRYQLAAHLQEGGDRGQEGAALIAKGNPIQLKCSLCDYVTSSLEKLRGHSLSSHHEASVRVYRFLQQYDGEVDGGSWLFHCLLCNHSSSSKLQVLKHSQTPTHQQREGLLQLEPMGGEELAAIFTIRKSSDGVTGELSEDIETSSETTSGPLDQTKDTQNLGVKEEKETEETTGEGREKRESLPPVKRPSSGCEEMENTISTKHPRIHQQNENQQTVQCPLCQVKLPHIHLRQHLTHVHSVAQDCVDKLMSTVTPSTEQPQPQLETGLQMETDSLTDDAQKNKNSKNKNANGSHAADSHVTFDSQKNKGTSVENTEGDVAAPKDVTALLTPPLEDTTAHPSNGRLAPQSPTQIPPSSPPTSPPSDPPPLSDRHGYRFRCSRCSLAFPTQEKLQLHWQYHAMRAATECPLCSRQCRSQEALQRHMQNTHSQLENTQGQHTLLSPHTAQTHTEHTTSSVQQDISLSPQVGQEAGEGEDEELDEEEEEEETLEIDGNEEQKDEVNIKEKNISGEADGVEDLTEPEKGPQEDSIADPSSSSLAKKSSNPTMDRYLDPSRPYKCTICSESFTQKTILLVHYNSVSHLHRARRALQESGPGVATPEAPRGPDPRPYRCRLCGVGYSQSSTLDIHLRSVLHQTRARAAQNPAPQTSASSVAASVSGNTIASQAATTREETFKSPSFTKRPDISSTSSFLGSSLAAEAQPTLQGPTDSPKAKKRVAELLASRNQLMLMQQQQQLAQAQAQLQQHTALLQSQLIQHLPLGPENFLKQHFALAPDNLLSLQQQLLLPFYLSGDMKLNPELAVKSPELVQLESASSTLTEQLKAETTTESLSQIEEEQAQRKSSDSTVNQPNDYLQCDAKAEAGCSGSSINQTGREHSTCSLEEEKADVPVPTVKTERKKEETDASCLLGLQCPPPRVPYTAVNGESLRALLQSYGYELALQYIQSRHRHQQQMSTQTQDKQELFDIKNVEVCSEALRGEYNEVENGKVEGCNEEDKQGVEGNGEIQTMLQEKKQNKHEELANRERECCGREEKCRDCAQHQAQASPTLLEQQQCKRTRTRISEEQLAVLRKHFDINSLPSDEEVSKMSSLSSLPHKVIKHWFRNTLFKERQRDKDSPYNFNNPPTIALEDSKEEIPSQPLIVSMSSVSPSLPANTSPQPQTADLQRAELHRGRRSSRTRFTEQQLETLQGVFEATPYPREEEYDRLSALLSLPNRVIVVWFQNARQRARKNQDRGTEDGLEGKNQLDNIQRVRNGSYKNSDDNEDNSCGDEGQGDCHNENSMDLTYEYYTHPDSPALDFSPHNTDSEHVLDKGELDPAVKKEKDNTNPAKAQANKSLVPVQDQNENILDTEIQSKELNQAIQTLSSPQPEPQIQPKCIPEKSQPQSSSSSQKTVPTILPASHSSPPSASAVEKTGHMPPSLSSAPESETSNTLPDDTLGLSTETKPQDQLLAQTPAHFQCSFCPSSLPSFQLWQEHQTRHLLAAQSQVQLLHSGFTDRTMPYMMLHPNHTLMASQILSGAMSQMHPNPTHPMIPHINSIQLKNTLSDHSTNTLTNLSQSSLSSMKQNSKLMSETSFEAQRGGREAEDEQRRDKRQRTTITPEQLEVLYQRYSLDSNPTRGVLESIARDVGLTRRVVQVWFQNTRARERKGQFRSMGPGSSFSLGLNHLRCPFCRALFKVKSALDAHMRSRHWAEAERAGYTLSMSNGSNSLLGNMANSSVMDRLGPSVSSNLIPNPGFAISNKEQTMKPPVTSLLSATDLNNLEEDEDYEDDDEEYPCEEGPSMADQGSLSPEGSGGPSSDWGETHSQQQHHQQQQRQRTQMSHFQILQLKDFYKTHRTPNRHECHALGQELGLPHRVVQVWFQNARAKEKRARSLSSDSAEREQAELTAGAGERDRA
ncbi:hypothetical protein LDENG_00008160 [Lucifuga dentata]|nr:hypothetical protein LDENG_00008160 [Lucifuga dentata]